MKLKSFGRPLLGATAVASAMFFSMQTPVVAAELKVGLREFAAGKGNSYSGCICTPGVFVWSAVYQQLVKIGPQGESQPFLATGWKNITPTTWQVSVRQGVKFSNGEALNADAVVTAYEYLWTDEGRTQSLGKSVGPQIAGAKKIDEYTVEFTTPAPDPVFPKRIQAVSIQPPKYFADVGLEGITINPIGTGPYKVTINAAKDSADGVRFDGAWKPVTGNVDRITWVELPEGPARAQALLSNQIDIDVSVSRDAVAQLEAAGLKTYAKPSTRTLGLTLVSFRSGKPADGPMADKRVRQALNYAVNKQAIVDEVYDGAGRPATQAAMQGVFGHNPDIKGYPYDPEKAKQLLAEAGYPNGFEMEFRAIMTDASFSLVYQSAVQDLNAIGIKANLLSQPFSEWIKPWLAGDWPYEGFGIGHDLTATMDAGRAFDTFSSCMKGGGTAENPKTAYYCNADEMPLINKAMVEFDAKERERMLQEALAVHTENAPIIFLIEFDETMGYDPRIRNFSHVNLWIPYEELQVDG